MPAGIKARMEFEPETTWAIARSMFTLGWKKIFSTAMPDSVWLSILRTSLTPELIDDFAITGPPDRCLARIEELAACGVGEISTAYLNGKHEQLRRVGESIIPALAAIPA